MALWDAAYLAAPPRVLAGATGEVEALAWSPDGTRLAGGGLGGVMQLWEIGDDARRLLTVHLFRNAEWCVLGADGRPRSCSGEVWRWLRWRYRDPVSGRSTLLAAEHFGPLPVYAVGSATSTPSR